MIDQKPSEWIQQWSRTRRMTRVDGLCAYFDHLHASGVLQVPQVPTRSGDCFASDDAITKVSAGHDASGMARIVEMNRQRNLAAGHNADYLKSDPAESGQHWAKHCVAVEALEKAERGIATDLDAVTSLRAELETAKRHRDVWHDNADKLNDALQEAQRERDEWRKFAKDPDW